MSAPESQAPRPLRRRPLDRFFVVCFGFFAGTSFFFDSLNAFDVEIAADSQNPLARATHWYAVDADPLLIENPIGLQIQTAISTFVFGPFYLVLIFALVKARNWIRLPALIYVGVMTYGMILFLGHEVLGPLPPQNYPKFLMATLPYLFIPLALGWRMRHPLPFESRED